MKLFAKILNKEGVCFEILRRKFPVLNREKLKAGNFDGLQIRELMKNPHFQHLMENPDADSLCSFCQAIRYFLRNYKADNYS